MVEISAALGLHFIDFPVDLVLPEKNLMGIKSADLSVVQYQYPVGVLNAGNSLRHDQLCGSGDFFRESLPDFCVCGGIHGAGGIVQNQNTGMLQKGSCNAQPLPLSAGDIGSCKKTR